MAATNGEDLLPDIAIGRRPFGRCPSGRSIGLADTGAFRELLSIYHLLGDPAFPLK
jgi:hypothetical protein